MRAAAALAAAVLLTGSAAAAGTPSNEAFVRALEAQPGVAVSRGDDGGGPYTEWRKAGVVYRLQRQGGGEVLIDDDESGAGAVACSWMIYNAVRDALSACPADRYAALRADLDRDIPAMEAFIVANSPLSVTAGELRARAEAERARTADTQPAVCTSEAAGGLARALDAPGPDGRRTAVDKLLAVPRWPVSSPCL